MSLCKSMKQISYGKQRETKNGTPQIEVVTDAMLIAPIHPGKQVKGFADMSKDDHDETSCAKELKERARSLSSNKQDD